jgi:hypothetical protein
MISRDESTICEDEWRRLSQSAEVPNERVCHQTCGQGNLSLAPEGGRHIRSNIVRHSTATVNCIYQIGDGTMSAESIPGVSIVKGVVEAFAGKGVALTTDAVSTDVHKCSDNCPWYYREREWILCEAANAGFSHWHWLAARIIVVIAFEWNGCDVNNARFRISPKTFNKWYNDSAKYEVTARGAGSKLSASSGCPECCGSSACVEFDIHLSQSWDWMRTAVDSWRVRICGDGSVSIV